MKKIIIFILLLTLTACGSGGEVTENPVSPVDPVVEDVDCEIYPYHTDCYEEPVVIDCVLEPTHPDCIVEESYDFVDIFYMNDLHGRFLDSSSQIGLSGIASYIENHEASYPNNTLVLAGGDMLQGSALSNYYNGYSTILLMNEIGFDAFSVGNHEFDWGIETVTAYFDGDESNGEADFPLLAANIFYEGTDTLLENTVPYVIHEIGDIEVAIIGTIGYGLEYSIATSKVTGYEFRHPVDIIGDYSEYLRVEEGVEIVIWMGHDTGNMNNEIASLTGDRRIDAMFNGHSHSSYIDTVNGIPAIQADSYGEKLGYLRIYFDETGVTSYDTEMLQMYSSAYFFEEDPGIESLIESFITETDPVLKEYLGTAADNFNKVELSKWLCELITLETDSAIAFHNHSGGTRSDIDGGSDIDIYKLYEIWPFDNQIKTVYLSGETINYLKQYSGLTYYSNVDTFIDDQYYKVATNDYIFDKTTNPFLDGNDIFISDIMLRDLVIEELRLQLDLFDLFDVTNEIQTKSE